MGQLRCSASGATERSLWRYRGWLGKVLMLEHHTICTGDITIAENIRAFAEHVLQQSGDGVHVVMADGVCLKNNTNSRQIQQFLQGFSVQGHEELQELASKQLYLCQALIALSILRTGGVYVCKLFDILTTFSAGLVYILRKCFNKVAIHKPNTSRPANAERFVLLHTLLTSK